MVRTAVPARKKPRRGAQLRITSQLLGETGSTVTGAFSTLNILPRLRGHSDSYINTKLAVAGVLPNRWWYKLRSRFRVLAMYALQTLVF
ncbi:hypothetical protein NDU88_006316 [Pleurodeles waltl]|uniref:Uncharacterized protein n=1 Tax=Pleurodeles waltl TaxID=8319 RepID=A0AAV7WFX8_PLEWA|nr:hypothetical protein NDU88_006316 [Pleurodeles waltl]